MTDQQKTDQLSGNPGELDMLDHAELGRLAEAADQPMPLKRRAGWWGRKARFEAAFTPAVCRALLSENAALRAERDAYRLVAINQGWNWKTCALHVDEDAYRKHREDHVDACAKSALQSIARETGK